MLFLPDLGKRQRQDEIMDGPDLDTRRHDQALRGLERINAWSGSARILWPAIRELAVEHHGRPVRLLDVATGAGDVPIRLLQKARLAGIDLRISACDRSLSALGHSRLSAERRQAAIEFFACDVLQGSLPADFDIITSSLFLHHLEEEQAWGLLDRMGKAAGRLVLVNDLRRCRLGYVLAYAGTRILSRSDVVHTDGPLSVRSAFTTSERTGRWNRSRP